MDVTQRFSSEVRKAIPPTRAFPGTPTGKSAPVGVVRGGGWPPTGGFARALGADLRERLGASWIDRLAGLAGRDVDGLLDALEDRAAARLQRLRSAELALVHERALLGALDEEQERLEREIARVEERIAERDADMHLALARGQEETARDAVRQIIPERRRSAALRAGIDRLARARERLRWIVARREATRRALRAPAFVPVSRDPTF